MRFETYMEPAREVPVADTSHVVICGGGPAGVAAAIAAARSGAKTRLLEVAGCLGGIWTAGLLSWIIDHDNKPGIMREITEALERRQARSQREGTTNYAYDPETMKLVLEEMCVDAGVKLQLHTRVVAVGSDMEGRLTAVITESKSGRQAWPARCFVDATGDGDVAALSGCGFDVGHEETGETQPMSLICLVAGVNADEVAPFIGGGSSEAKRNLLAEMQRAGVEPSYGAPTLFHIRDQLFALMANHEYGASATGAADVTTATVRARAEVHRLADGLRSLGAPWSNLRIVATANQIGTREARRIHGLYRVTKQDLLKGADHEDAVCRVTFGIDVHSTNPERGTAYEAINRVRTVPYDIPYRALIAKDVDGLLMAGRCISGDFLAHSSYRVTGNAVAMGQAAGCAAAIAGRSHQLPQDVPWEQIQRAIEAVSGATTAAS